MTDKTLNEMKRILFYIIILTVSCTKPGQDPFEDCECETVRGYEIKVCDGQDWYEASENALIIHEKDSDCPK